MGRNKNCTHAWDHGCPACVRVTPACEGCEESPAKLFVSAARIDTGDLLDRVALCWGCAAGRGAVLGDEARSDAIAQKLLGGS